MVEAWLGITMVLGTICCLVVPSRDTEEDRRFGQWLLLLAFVSFAIYRIEVLGAMISHLRP